MIFKCNSLEEKEQKQENELWYDYRLKQINNNLKNSNAYNNLGRVRGHRIINDKDL